MSQPLPPSQPELPEAGPQPEAPISTGREPLYERIGHWTSLITRWAGLTLIGYEVILDHLAQPTVLAIGTTLALGGKASDLLRKGGL